MTQPSRDWYRRTSWSPADEQDFFTRLKRARQKPQYLVLQASTLVETARPDLVSAGLKLVDRMIAECPDPFFLSNAYLTRAEALTRLGRVEEAVFAFRGALNARRQLPNVVNYAYIEFAWTVARFGLRQVFEEAIAALKEFQAQGDLAFPVNAYRYFGAVAIILADGGARADARTHAKAALDAIAQETGPFGRHPSVGVVDPTLIDPTAHKQIWALAAV